MSQDGTDPIISLRDVTKRFGENHVLTGVDLDVPRGKVTTIIGKSGTGKSVLLKCISGLLEQDSGHIEFAGKVLQGRNSEGRRLFRERCSYMFQHNALFDSLTAMDNVALPLREAGGHRPRAIIDRVRKLFDQLDLGPIGDAYPSDLSGGMQKRVALARALVTEPDLVLFDEPTTGLDPMRKNSVFEMIRQYQEQFGFTALLVSHDLPESLYVSDQVALLADGRIRFSGAPIDLESAADPATAGFLRSEERLLTAIARLRPRDALPTEYPEFRKRCSHIGLLAVHVDEGRGEDFGRVARQRILLRSVDALRAEAAVDPVAYGITRREFLFGIVGKETTADAREAIHDTLQATLDAVREEVLRRCTRVRIAFDIFASAETDDPFALLRDGKPEETITVEAVCPSIQEVA